MTSSTFAVAEGEPTYRLPRRDVWETVAKLDRRDPETGKTKKVRAVIVRWRGATGDVSEQRFWDALEAERFAQKKRTEIRSGAAPTANTGMKFSAWTDAYLTSKYPRYSQWKSGEVSSLTGDDYEGLLKVAADEFVLHVGDRPPAEFALGRCVDYGESSGGGPSDSPRATASRNRL